MKKYGFSDIVRIKAVDAKGLKSKRDLEDYDNLPCLSFDDDTSNIPHTACYLSHLRAVKYAINSKKEWTLILEDDAIFYKNPKATMGILYDIITKNKYNSAWLCS